VAFDPSLVAAIDAATAGNPRLRQAELLGAQLESGGSNTAVGAGSYGAFQIQLSAHPGVTVAQAESPGFAARFITPAYTAALAKVPAALWKSDPEKAAEETAALAERPAYGSQGQAMSYFQVRGAGAVDNAWKAAEGAYRHTTGTAPSTGSTGRTAAAGGHLFNRSMLVRVGLGATACVALLIGFGQLGNTGAGAGEVLVGGLSQVRHRSGQAKDDAETATGTGVPQGMRRGHTPSRTESTAEKAAVVAA
jgi:hypothetical protein